MQEQLTSKFLDEVSMKCNSNLMTVMANFYIYSEEKGYVQASVAMTPPGLPLPNGFHLGDGTATGAGAIYY